MNINNAFPSKWLKSGDLPEDDDLVVTIRDVTIEQVGGGDETEQKPAVHFDETEKALLLNKTNADTISKLHTPETDNWIGKRISLFATEVDFGGKQTLAIRVRMKAPKSEPPSNGGARSQAEPGTRSSSAQAKTALLDRYSALCDRANRLGIDFETISASAPAEKIIELGKKLKARIEAADQVL